MDLLDIPIERSSVDHLADRGNYGQALLELCRNHLLCIFNGRAGEDRLIGKATTKENTLIDYVIGSPFLLSKANTFRVNNSDNFFSDFHCRIIWDLSGIRQGPDMDINYTHPPDNNSNTIFFDAN